mmetsp:Transcript_139533/g.242746  ORF Transcript_139533/g.242746 Transcript_139533/m.242746 type:complete len:162 (-) Transcript_139533:199-684(-)
MSSKAKSRLLRDLHKLRKDPPHGVYAELAENNVLCCQCLVIGPEDTAWEGGAFRLQLDFTDEYPVKPPKATFVSKIFHPNVYDNGEICLDILQNQWTQLIDVSAILNSVMSLLPDPNPNSPANQEAARLYRTDPREYERRVKEMVRLTWKEEEKRWHGNNS